jgi:hypothetical protein
MNRITFIKSVYWIAAAVDAAVALGMVFPPLIQPALQVAATPTAVETRFALGTGAALMSGWTALLIWASIEPIARRGVLFLTAVPVIAGLALSTLYGKVHGYIPLGGALSVWALQGVLVVLLAVAYRRAVFCARVPDLSCPAVLKPGLFSPGGNRAGT